MTVRLLVRLVAVLAAVSVLGTVWFIGGAAQVGDLTLFLRSGPLGMLTFLGWGITLVAGSVAAVQLWRFREVGRRAGIIMFGYGLVYYLVGFFFLRTPEASTRRILATAVMFALPLGVLSLRRTRALFSPAKTDAAV